MNTEKLSHTGEELDRAISGWLNTLIPAYTLPEQVTFTVALDPTAPQVQLYWAWRNTENVSGIMVRRKQGELPAHSADGDLVCDISGIETTTFIDTAFSVDDAAQVGTMSDPVTWFYRAFPYNTNAQNQTHYQTTVNLGVISVNVYYIPDATTLESIAVGGTVIFGRYGDKDLVWKVANIEGDRAQLIMASNIIPFSPQFDSPETNNPNTDRKNYGNNRWVYSNIRQWLHADKAAGEWFVAQHDYDVCSWAATRDGFLYSFSEAEKGIIIPEDHTCLLPGVDGGGTETVVDSVWLPCRENYGLNSENNNYPEGTVFQLFEGENNTNAARAEGYGVNYWTRTAFASFAHSVRIVASAGSLNGYFAYNGHAVRAGLTIPLSTIIIYDDEKGEFVVSVA